MKYAPKVLRSFKVPALESAPLSLPSNEGIFDALVKFIKGYNVDSPGDEKDGQKIHSFRWVETQNKEILKTFGNEGWVKANFNVPKKPISQELAVRLSYKGKVPKPAEGLELGLKLVKKFLDTLRPSLTAYSNSLKELENSAEKRIGNGEDSVIVAKDTLKKARALKLPITPDFSYSDLIGGQTISVRIVKSKGISDNLTAPELSVEDIISAGKQLGEVTKHIDEFYTMAVSAGTGCDTDLWEKPGFDYNHGDMELEAIAEDLYEYFYFQQKPGDQIQPQYEAIFGYAEYAREVGRWLQAYTR